MNWFCLQEIIFDLLKVTLGHFQIDKSTFFTYFPGNQYISHKCYIVLKVIKGHKVSLLCLRPLGFIKTLHVLMDNICSCFDI